MADINLLPIAGMNNVSDDEQLQGEVLMVKDIINFDVTPKGRVTLRPQIEQLSAVPYKNLWQSPLHGDVFGRLDDMWVLIDVESWTHRPLAHIGRGDIYHIVLNGNVCVATDNGLFEFNGLGALPLAINEPSQPSVTAMSGVGILPDGDYTVAVSWLRKGKESSVSLSAKATVRPESLKKEHRDKGQLTITLPLVNIDDSIDGARVYMTTPNGGVLLAVIDAQPQQQIVIPSLPTYGGEPPFHGRSPMPSGKYLCHWKGRLIVAKNNMLVFSDAMAYHVTSIVYNYIQLPQRISFVQPVVGGLWVGQYDHVVFLEGDTPDNMRAITKHSSKPIEGSAVSVASSSISAEISQGEGACMWLSKDGYVIGTAQGQLIEIHAGIVSDITANASTSVVLGKRVYTATI